jgi:hypothetical protein
MHGLKSPVLPGIARCRIVIDPMNAGFHRLITT